MEGPEVISTCNECGEDILEDSNTYCESCYDEAVVYLPPEHDTCRRCGKSCFVNPETGYCSRGCELGFLPGQWWN